MKKRLTNKTFSCAFVLLSSCMLSCVDSEYDLSKDIDMTVTVGGENLTIPAIIRKSKFPQNPKRSVRFSGKRTKRSVQKRKARNTQKAETKVL